MEAPLVFTRATSFIFPLAALKAVLLSGEASVWFLCWVTIPLSVVHSAVERRKLGARESNCWQIKMMKARHGRQNLRNCKLNFWNADNLVVRAQCHRRKKLKQDATLCNFTLFFQQQPLMIQCKNTNLNLIHRGLMIPTLDISCL